MNKARTFDNIFKYITSGASFSVILIIIGIFITLLIESKESITKFGFFEFVTTTIWDPVNEIYGALTMIAGTILTTFLALLIAIPISIGIAIFIVELCPKFLKTAFGSTIELLASIPSIIYGMWGLFTLAPIMSDYIEPSLQKIFGSIPIIKYLFQGTPLGIDVLTASIVLSIMLIPFIASITRDTLSLTPQILKESAYGMGANQWEVIKDVMLPYSKYGIYGSIVIALGRALGETMAVAFVLGNTHKIPLSLFDSATTITVVLANEFTEATTDLYLSSLFFLALILFISSFIILSFAKYIIRKKNVR